MENTRTLNRNLETIAWGALFIWWGITELFQFLPHGTGAIGIGLILLGLNVARCAERHSHQRLYDHARHPRARVGRAGTGGLGPAPAVRAARLCDLADRAGRDLARARTAAKQKRMNRRT